MAARGNDRVAARSRARERRLALDAERRRRDERVDVAVADFDLAAADREAALSAVAACEVAMGAALAQVLAEGESVDRAAALCEVNASEVRRLTRLVPGRSEDGDESAAAPSPGARPRSSAA